MKPIQYLQVGFAFLVIAASMQLIPGVVFALSNASVTHAGNVALIDFLLTKRA